MRCRDHTRHCTKTDKFIPWTPFVASFFFYIFAHLFWVFFPNKMERRRKRRRNNSSFVDLKPCCFQTDTQTLWIPLNNDSVRTFAQPYTPDIYIWFLFLTIVHMNERINERKWDKIIHLYSTYSYSTPLQSTLYLDVFKLAAQTILLLLQCYWRLVDRINFKFS